MPFDFAQLKFRRIFRTFFNFCPPRKKYAITIIPQSASQERWTTSAPQCRKGLFSC
jgi:hypothetical protein